MARAHYVAKARKNYKDAGIKKGEPYWWWSFRSPSGRGGSGRIMSKTKPRGSQLTRSEFQSTLLSCQEQIEDLKADGYDAMDSFQGDVENVKSDLEQLESDTQEKFDNMPEGLQQGDTGQLLEARVEAVQNLVQQFESIDYDNEDGSLEERIQEILDEILGFDWSID